MAITYKLNITDRTTPADMDHFFNWVFMHRQRVHMVLDTTKCSKVSLGRIMSMKSVLDRHRPSSKEFIDYTTVYVRSPWAKRLLNFGLKLIRTERPVKIAIPE